LRYPASKAAVLAHAVSSGAEDDVLAALRALPVGVYVSPTSLAATLALVRSQ